MAALSSVDEVGWNSFARSTIAALVLTTMYGVPAGRRGRRWGPCAVVASRVSSYGLRRDVRY
eukprot:965740-Rhodomonas_salina.2